MIYKTQRLYSYDSAIYDIDDVINTKIDDILDYEYYVELDTSSTYFKNYHSTAEYGNSFNIGYHTMNNYKNIDCAIINESELRHELRDRDSSVETLMKQLTKNLQIKNMVVTQGSEGATIYSTGDEKFYNCPAFAAKLVDKIGSGDAMLALLSCSIKSGFDPDLSLFIGSLAAAQSVETIGNSVPVSKTQLLKTFSHAIK